jgi:hypothetical protein
MAKLIFGLSQSLDGYVDHLEIRPGPALFRHFVEHVRDLAGIVYGRRTYEIMRYWDEDLPEWDAEEVDFAAAWRSQPKWVVSRSVRPFVLGHGTPFFAGPRPPLRLVASDPIGEDTIRLTYVPA